jgi:hypothetical protein
MIEFLAARYDHCNSLMEALTEMSSSSPVIRNEIEPLAGRRRQQELQNRRDAAGDALHVDGAA